MWQKNALCTGGRTHSTHARTSTHRMHYVWTCAQIHKHVSIHICVYICVFACAHACLCVGSTCLCLCVYVFIFLFGHILIFVCTLHSLTDRYLFLSCWDIQVTVLKLLRLGSITLNDKVNWKVDSMQCKNATKKEKSSKDFILAINTHVITSVNDTISSECLTDNRVWKHRGNAVFLIKYSVIINRK